MLNECTFVLGILQPQGVACERQNFITGQVFPRRGLRRLIATDTGEKDEEYDNEVF